MTVKKMDSYLMLRFENSNNFFGFVTLFDAQFEKGLLCGLSINS